MTNAESFEGSSNTDKSVSVKPYVLRRGTKFVSGVVFQHEAEVGPVSEELRCSGEFDTYNEALAVAKRAAARIEKRLASPAIKVPR
ncbi:hypothetical protein [Paraburkholderia hospita]|uniref:hypothetical protein n=1 Tax=Paraburkholderia hospita TaxID=169430 RepID=UPI000B3454A5|nr:hypothetical protein [Paraburkholderia hospita]OUL79908.1 hypothetical protein CA603_33050 [Paraburkholderia hospita]